MTRLYCTEGIIMISREITKEQSYILKGIGILLMVVHHFFTFPEWIIAGGGGYAPNLLFAEILKSPTKLCVCIFAFVSGWAIALGKLTYKEAFRRIKQLFINFWCIAIPSIVFAVLICGFKISALDICKELLGLKNSVMIFSWYVPFYTVSMILMTFIQKWLDSDIRIALLAGVILPVGVLTVMRRLPLPSEIQKIFVDLRHWFPAIVMGYICNRYHWFEKVNNMLGRVNRILVSMVLIVICILARYVTSGLDFIYSAMLVFAIVNLRLDPETYSGRFLCTYGKHSSDIWFLHCLYFGEATRAFVQPLAYWAKYPLLIFIVAIVELLCCSEIIFQIKKRSKIRISH